MSKENCDMCQFIADHEKRSKYLVYEDEDIVAMLAPKPANIGHILIIPKEHYPIIENVPDPLVAHCFFIANKLSSAVFESLNVHGTNILVQNGISAGQTSAHFMVHVIGRFENDGINMNWQPKQVADEEMNTIVLQLSSFTNNIGSFEKEKEKPVNIDDDKKIISDEGKENYLIKSMIRIP